MHWDGLHPWGGFISLGRMISQHQTQQRDFLCYGSTAGSVFFSSFFSFFREFKAKLIILSQLSLTECSALRTCLLINPALSFRLANERDHLNY